MSNQGPRRNGPVKLRLTGEEGSAGLPGAHTLLGPRRAPGLGRDGGGRRRAGGREGAPRLKDPLDLRAGRGGGREEMRGSCRGRRGEESAARLCFSGEGERVGRRKAFSGVAGMMGRWSARA